MRGEEVWGEAIGNPFADELGLDKKVLERWIVEDPWLDNVEDIPPVAVETSNEA
jgi:hypothetical protein